MMRLGLAVYLMLTTAVGPWFCCCAASRILKLCTTSEPGRPAGHSCCGAHAPSPGHRSTGQEQGPAPSSPSPLGSCPCKEGRSQPVVFATSERSSAVELVRLLTALPSAEKGGLLLPASFVLSGYATAQTATECLAFPFHDCRDILTALHVLRC